jgi:hypothetical protein
MAHTPKPVRKYAKKVHKDLEKKYKPHGFEFKKQDSKDIAKSHHEKGLVTRKGKLNRKKVESSLEESRKGMRKRKK